MLQSIMQQQSVRLSGDVAAGSTILASWLGWLPQTVNVVGGILAAIWIIIQIYYKIKAENNKK